MHNVTPSLAPRTPLSHSTRRTLFVAGVIKPRAERQVEREPEYVPLALRRYDADMDCAMPVRRPEVA